MTLDLPEWGAVGEFQVMAVEASGPVPRAGRARRVTGLFRNSRCETYNLWVAGESEPIGVTALHPVWSADREAWVAAGELRIGERVRVAGGTAAVVRWEARGEEPVFNLEVEGDHCYRVGEQGVLVHNASWENCNPCANSVRKQKTIQGFEVDWEETELEEAGKKTTQVCRVWSVGGKVQAGKSDRKSSTSANIRRQLRRFFFNFERAAKSDLQKKLDGDHNAGHLIADRLGGPNVIENLAPFWGMGFNKSPGAWDIVERYIHACLNNSNLKKESARYKPSIATIGSMKVKLTYDTTLKGSLLGYIPTHVEVEFELTNTAGSSSTQSFKFKNESQPAVVIGTQKGQLIPRCVQHAAADLTTDPDPWVLWRDFGGEG